MCYSYRWELLVSMSSFNSLYDQPISRCRPFWDNYTEWPPNDHEPYIPICIPCVTSLFESQMSVLFCSTTSCFCDTGNFEINTPDVPKIILNPKRSNVRNNYMVIFDCVSRANGVGRVSAVHVSVKHVFSVIKTFDNTLYWNTAYQWHSSFSFKSPNFKIEFTLRPFSAREIFLKMLRMWCSEI